MAKTNEAQREFAKWRKDRGLTMDDMAKQVGLSREYVRRIESGHVIPVKYETRWKIEEATGIRVASWEAKR